MLPSAKGLTLEVTGSHRFEPLAWAVPNHFSTQILFWTRTSSLKWAQGSSASCFSLRFFCSSPSSGAVSAFSYCDVQEEGINSANLPTAMLIARTWLEVPREVFSWTASNSFSVKRPKKHNIIIIIILLNCLFRSSSFCNLVHGYKVRLHMATDRFMPFPICFPTFPPAQVTSPTWNLHRRRRCFCSIGLGQEVLVLKCRCDDMMINRGEETAY